VNGIYSADASATPASVCTGGSTQLNVIATGGEVYIYSWTSSPAGFTSPIQNPVVTPSVATTYKVIIKNGPCVATDSITVTVNSPPAKPGITLSGNMLESSSSSGNQWFRDGSELQGATSQLLDPPGNGQYQVQVTDANGCVSELSDPFDVTWLSADQISSPTEITIYPNPTTGVLTISTTLPESTLEISVFNSLGKNILTEKGEGTIDLSGFEDGIYFLIVKSQGGKAVSKKVLLIK
jgi:hypothetical protein